MTYIDMPADFTFPDPITTVFVALPTKHHDGVHPVENGSPYRCYELEMHHHFFRSSPRVLCLTGIVDGSFSRREPNLKELAQVQKWYNRGLFSADSPSAIVDEDRMVEILREEETNRTSADTDVDPLL